MSPQRDTLRIDKWLWHARFFKTRSLAARVVSEGKLRINGARVSKPAAQVGAGDTLTFRQAREQRVIRIEALGTRRGPAPEARALYEDLQPPEPRPAPEQNPRYEGKGRPTKREGRILRAKLPPTLE
ncbi:RNA-binding S4 domain-containing protein [Poseidonocella sedimentorum]|uniref:Heat shock protein Hsp15 n=1 Tax=Poseidonocella sedimentorum TaxID=871652 RepID=A0A1I6CW47_9RHOB|nr:RNA-binding S4 domain-containing protein [Poseidonocella sedimentorum]SFQ97495.1 heat shock protein Hsp15 [Poseidonocella sedimentorum]